MKHVQYWGATSIWGQSMKIEPPRQTGAGDLYTPALLHTQRSKRRRNSGFNYGKLSPLVNFCLICLTKTEEIEILSYWHDTGTKLSLCFLICLHQIRSQIISYTTYQTESAVSFHLFTWLALYNSAVCFGLKLTVIVSRCWKVKCWWQTSVWTEFLPHLSATPGSNVLKNDDSSSNSSSDRLAFGPHESPADWQS